MSNHRWRLDRKIMARKAVNSLFTVPATHSMALFNHCSRAFKAHGLLEGHYLHESQISVWAGRYLLFTSNCVFTVGGKMLEKSSANFQMSTRPKESRGCVFWRAFYFNVEIRESVASYSGWVGPSCQGWSQDGAGLEWLGMQIRWEARWKIRSLLWEWKDLQREVSRRPSTFLIPYQLFGWICLDYFHGLRRTFVWCSWVERFLKKRRRKRQMCSLK